MKGEPKVGEIIIFNYQRYKTVETNKREMGMECQGYCDLAGVEGDACSLVHCSPEERLDSKFVHFVKLAPRKRRHTL